MRGISEDHAVGELTAPQLSDYHKLIRRGALLSPNGQYEPSAEQWFKDKKHRWERIRGVDFIPPIEPHNPLQHARRLFNANKKRKEEEERARSRARWVAENAALGKGKDASEDSKRDRRRELVSSAALAPPKSDDQTSAGPDLMGVGRKVYLPNIIFRLMPNHTPKGEPYNPYEATFRIPQSVTKTDVRSYLRAMYGLQITYIRTDNYFSPIVRRPHQPKGRHVSRRTFKRAVVGLVSPFVFPEMMEDMALTERESRQKYLNETFYLDFLLKDRREAQVRSLGIHAGWNGRVTGKKNILNSARDLLDKREEKLVDAMDGVVNHFDKASNPSDGA
jgi:hypothetical protein